MQDTKKLAEQQHAIDVARGRALPDGTKVRTADGTPILPRRLNSREGNRLEDNWGYPIHHPNVIGANPDRPWTNAEEHRWVADAKSR